MYLSIVASLLGFAVISFGIAPAYAAETNDTQTNTQINTGSLSLDAFKNPDELNQLHQTLNTLEQQKYDQQLSDWKKKQAALWKNLPKEKFTINASAYTAAADECGKSNGVTASGIKVAEHRTLACPANFPFGAKIRIEGLGEYTCEDRGGAIVDNHIDIYMKTKAEAFAFGRRLLSAEIVQ